MSDQKRFEEWEKVDCNECERWWTNQCDGANIHEKRSKRLCNSFLATRSVIIPEQIKRLSERINWLGYGFLFLSGLVLALIGIVITHW